MDKKFKLTIIIDGKSANELFNVGPKDLKLFIKERFNVNEKDIKTIAFEEDLSAEEFGSYIFGERTRTIHKDNYFRGEDDE